ncbi:MAG TPA: protein phosphatase 2C domain-containing protein [Streptosporangiaceae bacterium]|nr:protein phosphatase 2C domain-containing protein [Streptosporangiaceae bacterium]
MTLALRYAVRSDVGLLREGNEDSAYAGPHLLAVADGMGGYEAGEVASAAVISTVAPLDQKAMPESELIEALAGAVATAKQTLRRIVDSDPTVGSMGTTLTAMLWAGGSAAICHIGDSRAYLVRDGDLYQITRDHTFVQALIDQGRIQPEEAATHPQRSLLLRALDGRTDADPDLSMLDAQVGDRYLICSDGLPVAVSDEQILQALVAVPEPADAVVALVDLAIRGGAPDNVTCIVADVIDTDQSGVSPTSAPVTVGAATNTGGTDTKPFTRPGMDGGSAGVTMLGAVPAAAGVSSRAMAGQGTAQQSSAPRATARSGTQHSPAAAVPGRHAAEPALDEEERPRRRRRRRWPLMTSILALFVILIGAGLIVGYQYVHSQYYVGTKNGKVTIFRGLDQQLFGVSLSSVYRPTDVPVAGLPSQDVQAIRRLSSGSLSQATSLVSNVRTDYQGCQNAYKAVRHWEATKPKSKPIRNKTGRIIGHTHPKIPPKPSIPAGCPPMPASGT